MVSDAKLVISDSRVISHGDRSKGVPRSEIVPWSERVHPVFLKLKKYIHFFISEYFSKLLLLNNLYGK